MNEDIRWIQRLKNFKKAFYLLEQGVELAAGSELSDLEKEGVIQRFEYTQELAWKTIKDFYLDAGETNIHGSSDAFKLAFKEGLIVDGGQALMKSIKSRNKTVHTYNEKTAAEIFHEITDEYYAAFKELLESFESQKQLRGL